MAKRITSALLVLALALSLLGGIPVGTARAAEPQLGENETERDELTSVVAQGKLENITWMLESDGKLTISGEGDMPHCQLETDVPWLEYSDQITSAVIEKGITTVGIFCFYQCLKLESVSIPEGVTSIGNHAFEWCRKLKEVILPDSVKSIGLMAFYNCDGMETLELGGVEMIANDAFNMCRSLTEVTFPATLTEMKNYSFACCDSLTTITFEGDAPTFSGQPFSGTGSFPNETVTAYYPGDNATWTSDVMTDLGGDIDWKTTGGETVEPEPETIGGNCGKEITNLTWTLDEATGTLTVSGTGEMQGVSSWVYTPWAEYADQIKTVVLEEGVVSVGSSMFGGLTELEGISFPSTLRWIQDAAFEMTTSLKSVTFPETLESIGSHAFWGSGLTEVTVPENTKVYAKAFAECQSLTKVTLEAGFEGGEEVFAYCPGLTDVTVKEGVTALSASMFANCTGLESVVIPGTVEQLGWGVFDYCTALSDVTLEDGVKVIGPWVFRGCTALTEIEIPGSVETMEQAVFNYCENLEEIRFLGGAPDIDDSAFSTLKVTAYYPSGVESWNDDTLKYYGSVLIDWVPYGHTCQYTPETVAPTCTELGYTKYSCTCGDVYLEDYVEALGHDYESGECTRCGDADPNWVNPDANSGVTRLAGTDRFDTAFLVADQMKENLGIEKFEAVIVASGTNFADALSGSYLAAVKNAPILLSFNAKYNQIVKDYIRENLAEGGTVYILGGPSAVPATMETGMEGFVVKRLAGEDRFGTNLAILAEAGVGDKPVLVCTGVSFADSLSASASKLPILLVYKNLTDGQRGFLDSLNGNQLYIIGGESAVDMTMQEQIETFGPTGRIGGGNRFETSVLIAEMFFDSPKAAVLAYAWNYPDGLCGGALAATMDAPLILTMTKFESAAADYIHGENITTGTVLGGTGLISEKSVQTIFPEPEQKPGNDNKYEDELPIG
ncbi:MAG: leucine-rich repeat protein [Oscillospiraceae bacterium]|nr:leucine-rich repeat protein [Oscillospiraceae bacterium]